MTSSHLGAEHFIIPDKSYLSLRKLTGAPRTARNRTSVMTHGIPWRPPRQRQTKFLYSTVSFYFILLQRETLKWL